MRLTHDLHDIYGRKIAEKDYEITPSVIRALIKQGTHLPKKLISIGTTFILQDFKAALKDPRYHALFTQDGTRSTLVNVFSRVKLTEPLILELGHMKAQLPEGYHHVLTMAALTIKMIKDIKKTRYDPLLAASLCLTHDIGKMRIPKRILNKKSALSVEQYRIIQTHPLIGYLLLCYYVGWEGKQYCETAFEHHEKLDGSGYPRGIKKIDRYAQLIAPVDIYDALISKRPYRKMSYNGRLALDILIEDAKKKKLSLEHVYLLINAIRARKVKSLKQLNVSEKRRTAAPTGNSYGKIKKAKARRLLRSD